MTGSPAVRRGQASGAAGGPAADLTAIRHSDTLLDLLARRELSQSLVRRDPALAVLSLLAADVDGQAAVTAAARRAAARRVAAWRTRQLAAPARPRPVTVAAIVSSALAALVLAVVAAGATGIVAAGLLARLARPGPGPGAGPPRRAGR